MTLVKKFKELNDLKKKAFFTEVGNMIHQRTIEMKRDRYAFLTTIQLEHK